MTAIERLQSARASIHAGQYPEALQAFIWFHENALAENRALSGVRLSFALGEWAQLGKAYPPALAALESVRDQKAAALVEGVMGRSEFRDVAAINFYLEASSLTYSLYRKLMSAQPELASACASDALPSIVDAADYHLAAQLAPDAETTITRESKQLNYRVRMLKHEAYSRAPTRWAYVCNHVAEIQRLLKIKEGIGENAEAIRLKSLAIALIESPSLRREVAAGFIKRPRAPMPRVRNAGR